MLKPLDVKKKKKKQVTEQETVILDQVILVYFQGPVVLKEEFLEENAILFVLFNLNF